LSVQACATLTRPRRWERLSAELVRETPCLLPEVRRVRQLTVDDARYWPLVVTPGMDARHLRHLLVARVIAVQRRPRSRTWDEVVGAAAGAGGADPLVAAFARYIAAGGAGGPARRALERALRADAPAAAGCLLALDVLLRTVQAAGPSPAPATLPALTAAWDTLALVRWAAVPGWLQPLVTAVELEAALLPAVRTWRTGLSDARRAALAASPAPTSASPDPWQRYDRAVRTAMPHAM
jgi:hypothetical protein